MGYCLIFFALTILFGHFILFIQLFFLQFDILTLMVLVLLNQLQDLHVQLLDLRLGIWCVSVLAALQLVPLVNLLLSQSVALVQGTDCFGV